MIWLLAAVFLPLFPLSMAFTLVLHRARRPGLRAALLLAWPLTGVALLTQTTSPPPDWWLGWALASALLYALRLLALREMGLWIAYLATSAWALLWVPHAAGVAAETLLVHALGFSLPLVLLALLAGGLEARYGAAYTGLYGGLGSGLPRFAGVLVVTVLAATATPLFPAFFAMLAAVIAAGPLIAVALVLVWLLWSWAAARLLQGLIVGPAAQQPAPDLSPGLTWLYALGLLALMVAGIALTGDLA